MMSTLAVTLVLSSVMLVGYTYAGYPLLLALLARVRGRRVHTGTPAEWPLVSITVPVYNEEAQIRGILDTLLAQDYPAERRQILVVSDASTDATDDIVRSYGDRGVELVRTPVRGGKGAAEATAAEYLRGEIVVNVDASVRMRPNALRSLIAAFADPTVGVASGRDRSVAEMDRDANAGESRYVGYEMLVRRLETGVDGIIGSSGCFYGIREHLHRKPLPASLSRDFASALVARENGYRAVSVDEAVCFVPRTASLHREYERKVRTMTRGMRTLWHKRHLLDPLRYGWFAWMLLSHKVCRWLVPWTLPLALLGFALLSAGSRLAALVLAGGMLCALLAAIGWRRARHAQLPRVLAIPTFFVAGNLAAIHASLRALRGSENAIWEPTRRGTVAAPAGR